MAARGIESKEIITKQILDTFSGSFKYDKEIRVPMIENGEEIQIKIVLTAAKTNVEHGGDTALPNASMNTTSVSQPVVMASPTVQVATEPTEEEKQNLQKLVASLF